MKLSMKLFLAITSIFLLFNVTHANDNAIGFDTVESAHQALDSDPDAVLTEYEGWKVYKKKLDGTYELWSFTPFVHAANPTVVKRTIQQKGGELTIVMSALCEAATNVCDDLIEDFKEINRNIKARYQGG